MEGATSSKENRVLITTTVMSALLLGAFFVAAYFIAVFFGNTFTKHQKNIHVALMLFALWMTITSSIRTIDKTGKGLAGFKLVGAGLLIGLIGTAIYALFRTIFQQSTEATDVFFQNSMLWFFPVLALIFTLATMAKLRFDNTAMGTILEWAVIIGFLALMFYLKNKV